MEIDYDKGVFLQYSVNQTVHNYTYPSKFLNVNHEIDYNITFSNSGDWIVSVVYRLDILNPETQKITFYLEYTVYKFRDDSKLIYSTAENNFDIDYTDSHSFISGKTDLNLGETQLIRIADMWIILGGMTKYEENVTYTRDQSITLNNKDYTVRIFEGNISDITGCAV